MGAGCFNKKNHHYCGREAKSIFIAIGRFLFVEEFFERRYLVQEDEKP
jgi:hypothetical protein